MRQKFIDFITIRRTKPKKSIAYLIGMNEWVSVWRFHANQIPPTHVRYVCLYVCAFISFILYLAFLLDASFLRQEFPMHRFLEKKKLNTLIRLKKEMEAKHQLATGWTKTEKRQSLSKVNIFIHSNIIQWLNNYPWKRWQTNEKRKECRDEW